MKLKSACCRLALAALLLGHATTTNASEQGIVDSKNNNNNGVGGEFAKPLRELSTEEAVALLQVWNLDGAFAEGFRAHRFDGGILSALLEVGDLAGMASELKSQFPYANVLQWIKLKNEVQALDAGAVPMAAIRSELEEKETAEQQDSDARRRGLGLASSSLDGFSGVHIRRDMAMLALGPAADVSLRRDGNASLAVDASSLDFSADDVNFAAGGRFVVNGTDLLRCCRDGAIEANRTGELVQYLLAEATDMRKDIMVLKQELVYLETRFNASCTAVDEAAYSCDDYSQSYTTSCVESVTKLTTAWTDRTYAFQGAPANLLDSYHTYLKVPMSTSPPCSTEGGFVGTLLKDAQVGICCANHGTYTSAEGNVPYAASVDDDEGYDNRYGLEWTAHSGEFSLSNHGGTPCSFFETFLEAGKHRICCSEAWASGVFLSTPAVTCA